jgi:hypothetical protein
MVTPGGELVVRLDRQVNEVLAPHERLIARSAGWVVQQFTRLRDLRQAADLLLNGRSGLGDATDPEAARTIDELLAETWSEMARVEASLGTGRALQRLLQPGDATAVASWLASDMVAELDVFAALYEDECLPAGPNEPSP